MAPWLRIVPGVKAHCNVDVEARVEAGEAWVETLLACGQLEEAAAVTAELAAICHHKGLQLPWVKVLLLLARVHQAAGSVVCALPYALSCRNLCKELHLELLAAAATCTLAELCLALGKACCHVASLLAMLRASLPLVLGQGSMHLQVRTQLAIANCVLSSASPEELVADPDAALAPLAAAAEGAVKLGALRMQAEAYHLQAVVYNSLGRLEERDLAASHFQRCDHIAC
ncbi:hypothetical protein CYMTET_44203 [Cymbomonas tetramitiformis]|uniref:Uncharacterized protein n=1 Tax=Cymbomonas tetramitiformis TaxID=36881 RepID=A0AAE0C1X7_9CHLO|nr:hypothetical protein CYMTET_44203 [Cymbomonas tetramitiformis]